MTKNNHFLTKNEKTAPIKMCNKYSLMKLDSPLNSLKAALVFIAASAFLTASLATSIAQNVTMSGNFVTVPGGTLNGTAVTAFQISKFEVTWGEWQQVRASAVAMGYSDLVDHDVIVRERDPHAGYWEEYYDEDANWDDEENPPISKWRWVFVEYWEEYTHHVIVGNGVAENHPVQYMSWKEAVKWCNLKSEMERLTPVYTVNGTVYRQGDLGGVGGGFPEVNRGANGYRLPSEVEWLYAAKGGASRQGYAYSGSNDANAVAWYSDNTMVDSTKLPWQEKHLTKTKAVGTKAANELGIHDMTGNVNEWTDRFGWVSGGSWGASLSGLGSLLNYSGMLSDERSVKTGFRLARSLTPVITSQSTGNGEISAAFTYQITASHSPTRYTASGLPPGLTVNATTGLISGKPTALGNFSVNLGATNSSGTGNAVLALAIAPRITVTSNATAPATQGMPFRYQITASNPPHVSYAVFRGLPAGTTWNATTGLIAGTPTVSGNFLITATANNAFGSSAAKWVAIQVAPAPMPVIASFDTIGNVAFQAYNTQPAPVLAVTANNPSNNPLTYQWFKDGVAIAGATGTTYNPGAASTATAGYYHVVLKNAANQTVASPNLAFKLLAAATFAISGPVNQSFSAGANATFSVSSLGGLPPGNATVAYQWYRNGVAISGATSSNYTVPGGMSSATAGSYAVDVTTRIGSTVIGTVRSTSWAFTPQDTGILVYTLSGTSLRTISANETTGTLTGYVVVDRANNNAAIIQTYGSSFGRRNSLEMRPDIAVASTGPVLGSRTVLAGSLNNGDTPVDHDMVWVTGKDAEVVVAATTTSPILPQVRLFAPTSMTGFMCILARNPASVEIEHYGVTLSLNTALTAASYRNGQNLTQAIAAARAAATTAGFPNAETNP